MCIFKYQRREKLEYSLCILALISSTPLQAMEISEIDNDFNPRLQKKVSFSFIEKNGNELQPLSPIVKQKNDRKVIDPEFISNVPLYAEMADLSYRLIKGENELSTEYLEKFMNKGWKVTAFGGFSGNQNFDKDFYDAKSRDLGGFVAFNRQTCEAIVCFHGSQDPHDWENNYDLKKISASKMKMKFSGKIHRGFAGRYASSRVDIYDILTRIYKGLENNNEKQKFHITTTGHSLGAAMATIGYADLSTQFAQKLWGKEYKNTNENRIRAYVMSPPRAFDEEAVQDLTQRVGIQNIIIDTNNLDLVSKVGPGRTLTKWLNNSSNYGPTALVLGIVKMKGIVDTSNPQEVARNYGGYRHLGTKAIQSSTETFKIARSLPTDPKLALVDKKQGFFK